LNSTEVKHLSRSHYRICRGHNVYDENRKFMFPPQPQDEGATFTPDLVTASGSVLSFLTEVQKLTDFNSPASVEPLMKLYLSFLILQEENPSEALIPSKPIQAIWFSHMLQSCGYKTFILENFSNIWKLNHPATRIELDETHRRELESRTQKLMDEKFPKDCDFNSIPNFLELWKKMVVEFTPETVIYDRDWILEFNKFTSGTDVKSVKFREKAYFGYRRLIYLKWKNSVRVEEIGFSPCPSVDLLWHTHLVHPETYEKDMEKVIGHVPAHKLLDVNDRTEAWMDTRDDQSMQMWQKEFQESIFVYAVV